MLRPALAVALLAALVACQSLPSLPPGTYPPVNPGNPLPDRTPGCAATGTARECWDQRPGESWAWICADGLTRVPGRDLCPTSTTCVIPDGIEGQGLSRILPAPPGDPVIAEALRTAIRARRTCDDGLSPRCLVGVSLEAWRQEIVAQLGAQGVCAGVQGGADEVCVLQAPGKCQGWRVGTCDGSDPIHGCDHGVVVAWPTSGAVRDTWVKDGTEYTLPKPDGTGTSPAGPADTTCDAGTPEADEYAFGGWGLPRDPSKRFVFVSAKVKNAVYCSIHNEDPRAQVVCPFWPEGHPKRKDCETKHGLPVWFGDVAVREDNPFSAEAPNGARLVVCRRSSCSDPAKQETCSACSETTLP